MEAKVSRALLDRAASALGMEDARDREVLAAALERYAAANPPLANPPDPDVDTSGATVRVHVPVDVSEEMHSIRLALGGTGDTSPGEAAERALAYAVSTGGSRPAGMPTPGGMPPLFAPDPAGMLTRDARAPVVDPLYLLVLGGG